MRVVFCYTFAHMTNLVVTTLAVFLASVAFITCGPFYDEDDPIDNPSLLLKDSTKVITDSLKNPLDSPKTEHHEYIPPESISGSLPLVIDTIINYRYDSIVNYGYDIYIIK